MEANRFNLISHEWIEIMQETSNNKKPSKTVKKHTMTEEAAKKSKKAIHNSQNTGKGAATLKIGKKTIKKN